jgi:mRNA-degrading endonuclease toxin of MazEF toxin-antitoxin module
MRRGEIWRYQPALGRTGQSTLRLIVSASAINEAPLPMVLAVHVLDTDPGGLLAVPVGHHGWASALTIEAVTRTRLVRHVDTADDDTMEGVALALRAAQDL